MVPEIAPEPCPVAIRFATLNDSDPELRFVRVDIMSNAEVFKVCCTLSNDIKGDEKSNDLPDVNDVVKATYEVKFNEVKVISAGVYKDMPVVPNNFSSPPVYNVRDFCDNTCTSFPTTETFPFKNSNSAPPADM